MSKNDADDRRWALARTKFGLIAPVINNTFTDASKTAYFKRMEGSPVTFEDGQVRYVKASTMAEWCRRYELGGLEALLPASRSDSGGFRSIDDDIEEAFLRIRSANPAMPVTVAYGKMIEEGAITPSDVSLSTLQRYARKLKEAEDGGTKPERRAFEAECVNGCWQADTLYGPFVTEDGTRRRAYLQTIVDDKSRLITGSRFTLSDDTASFMSLMKGAVITYGAPAKLYVDNGGAYRNSQLATACAQVGTVIAHAPVRDGAAKGKIERLNRTIRTKFLSTMSEDCGLTLDELNGKLAAWVVEYNSTEHSSTGRKPIDVWAEASAGVRRVDPRKADEMFRFRVKRTVANDSTIRLEKVLFDVPMGHAGERVEVIYEPGIAQVWVAFDDGGDPVRVHRTDKVANGRRARRGTRYKVDYAAAGGE